VLAPAPPPATSTAGLRRPPRGPVTARSAGAGWPASPAQTHQRALQHLGWFEALRDCTAPVRAPPRLLRSRRPVPARRAARQAPPSARGEGPPEAAWTSVRHLGWFGVLGLALPVVRAPQTSGGRSVLATQHGRRGRPARGSGAGHGAERRGGGRSSGPEVHVHLHPHHRSPRAPPASGGRSLLATQHGRPGRPARGSGAGHGEERRGGVARTTSSAPSTRTPAPAVVRGTPHIFDGHTAASCATVHPT